jgi:hypothetical protein
MMEKEPDATSLFRGLFICIGSYLIGNEYGSALGWGVWFIAMALD